MSSFLQVLLHNLQQLPMPGQAATARAQQEQQAMQMHEQATAPLQQLLRGRNVQADPLEVPPARRVEADPMEVPMRRRVEADPMEIPMRKGRG